MNARHLDHVNLRIPADGADATRTFYGEQLGFGIEDTLYETGEKPFLDARLSATAVVHLWPTDEFEAPTATNFGHFCVVVEEPIDRVRSRLDEEDVAIDDELAARGDRRGSLALRRRPVRLSHRTENTRLNLPAESLHGVRPTARPPAPTAVPPRPTAPP